MSQDSKNVMPLNIGDWKAKLGGYYRLRHVELKSPVVHKMFQRSILQAMKELYSLMIFTPFVIPEKSGEIEALVSKALETGHNRLDQKLTQINHIRNDTNAPDVDGHTRTYAGEVPFTTPQSVSLIELFIKADTCHELYTSMWLNGDVSNDERAKFEEEIKQILRKPINTVHTTFLQINGAANKRRKDLPPEQQAVLDDALQETGPVSSADEQAHENDADAAAVVSGLLANAPQANAEEAVPA